MVWLLGSLLHLWNMVCGGSANSGASGWFGWGEGGQYIQLALEKAAKFLASKQNTDGGWGESFESCLRKEYVPHATSQIVNTSWALLSLMAIKHPDKSTVKRGIDFLLSRQMDNGDFPQRKE